MNDFMSDFSDPLDEDGWLSEGLEGNEESQIGDSDNKNTLPFDPSSVKITVETVTIFNIAQRLKHKQIDLYPDFQRKANLWKEERKSGLIESLLLRFPLPAFYFDIENENKWLVVDGLQRLSTLQHFIVETENPLILEGLELLSSLNGKTFKELDVVQRRRILETNLTTFQIQAGTPKAVKYNVFKRINTGGLGLTPMEIRHALNQKGAASKFFKTLEQGFFKAFVEENKIPTSRMEDRELALRYIAFTLMDYKTYKPSLGSFLDTAIELLDDSSEEKGAELLGNLESSINTYQSIFDNTRFGRGLTRRAKMNSALFEVWASELGKLNEVEKQKLIAHKEDLKTEYQNLLWGDFGQKIRASTAGKGAVTFRFESIINLIKKYLND
jgi:hypothetical protein